MKNLKFPNFNFDIWLEDYIILIEQLINNNIDIAIVRSDFKESKEDFYNQNHTSSDSGYCLTCLYIRDLNEFTALMRLISVDDLLLSTVVKELSKLLRKFVYHKNDQKLILDFLENHNIKYTNDIRNAETDL